ncbi:hypothetical protein BH10BAC2_BH10BAC2_46360 [soil metagenome]
MKIGITEKRKRCQVQFSIIHNEPHILQAYMTEEFILSVQHTGQEYELKANMISWGYSHKFLVIINNTEVYFEPDEEGSYRAIMMPGQDEKVLEKIDRGLIHPVQESIEKLLA